MNYEKALYFVTKEKKVQHVGFFTTLSQMQLLESKEVLKQQGFQENPDFLREIDDSAYLFSSFIPRSVVDTWFDQICSGRSTLRKVETKREKEKKEKKKRKKRERGEKKKKPARAKEYPRSPQIFRAKKSDTDIKKIQNRRVPKQKSLFPRIKPPKRKKTPDTLKEEVKAQRRWETNVPTCGECAFWENQYLKYTQVEVGVCSVTGNFVSPEKKACSEFERPQ